jgi:hypothetical protein
MLSGLQYCCCFLRGPVTVYHGMYLSDVTRCLYVICTRDSPDWHFGNITLSIFLLKILLSEDSFYLIFYLSMLLVARMMKTNAYRISDGILLKKKKT